jgi:ubiquinone/menaquinone biosynthesis C-methylase UbiE
MLIDQAPRTLAQVLMEWEPLVQVYESRLWRRSVIFTALMGISFDREYSLIVEAAHWPLNGLVLDLACGPGIYARRFAAELPDAAIYGLDLSMPMLRYASRRAREEGLRNLLVTRGDASDLPFEDALFDGVNCCGALHLFPDVPRVLSEVHRVLKAEGYLTLALFRRSDTALARLRNKLRRYVTGISAFAFADLSGQLADAGFSEPRCLHAGPIWMVVSARRRSDLQAA